MGDVTSDFDKFWSAYPIKIARAAAFRAFVKAAKDTDIATILAGVERYKNSKASWQAWAHASTWLNGRRWEDNHKAPVSPPAPTDWNTIWRLRLRNYKPGAFWNITWGARPEDGGTDIPRHILAEWLSDHPEK